MTYEVLPGNVLDNALRHLFHRVDLGGTSILLASHARQGLDHLRTYLASFSARMGMSSLALCGTRFL